MTKKYASRTTIILAVLILLGSYYMFSRMTRQIPFECPEIIINYNGKSIPTSLGDHNWTPKSGGSSYETEGEYVVGKKTPKFIAKSGDTVSISIQTMQLKPKSMVIEQIKDVNKYKEYKTFAGAKEYELTLPIEKGEYIFSVCANWDDDDHNTSTIFQVEIE